MDKERFGALHAPSDQECRSGDGDRVTRSSAAREYTSKDGWREIKGTVRQIESDNGALIFDDAIHEKAWTDESELICWHDDHAGARSREAICSTRCTAARTRRSRSLLRWRKSPCSVAM